jgi:hypothetical protein
MTDSTRTLVIRRSDDETFDLFLDGAFVTSLTYTDAGLSGTEAAVETAKKLGAAPSELCCHRCSEVEHPAHPRGVRCVLEGTP